MHLQADNLILQAELLRKEAELRLLRAQHLATIDNLVMARSRRRPARATAASRRGSSERPSTAAV